VRDVLEPWISLNVFQSALSENVRRCKEDLDCHLLALRVESVIDPALLACFENPRYFFQLSNVENFQDCEKCSFVKDFLEGLQILA